MSKKKIALLVIGGLVVVLGIIGALTSSPEEAKVVATPTTVTAPAPAPVTKTVEKVVEKSPASCKLALGYADQGFTIAGEALSLSADAMGYVSRIFAAAAEGDSATVEELTTKITNLTPQMTEKSEALQKLSPKYRAARDDCNSK